MTAPTSDNDPLLQRARRHFEDIPHGRRLGLEVVQYQAGALLAKLPYRSEIVGTPYAGYLHSGALSVLIDQASGVAALLKLAEGEGVATLDLRVDHMRPARPEQELYARAECYRLTREVVFVRCLCYENDPADPVATSMSTFMRTRRRRPASLTKGASGNG